MTQLFNSHGLMNIKLIDEAVKTYCLATEITTCAINEVGELIASSGIVENFCKFYKEITGDKCPCCQSHLYASKQAAYLGESYIFFCPAGLVNFTAPIVNKKIFEGAIIAGPVLMDYPDEIMVNDLIRKNDFPIGLKGKLLSYLKTIPIVDPTKVRYLSKLLFIITSNLCDDKNILYERNQRMRQQNQIGQSIHDIKQKNSIFEYYPYEKEKELIVKVKNGDGIGAKTILNEVLGHIMFESGGKIEIIKARTLELCTLLSRAAVEGGAELDKIFGLNYEFIGELSRINNIEELSYWILKVLDKFTKSVFALENSKNVEVLKKSLKFINENYMNHITLESVAKYIHLNPSYFSTIFKKETGMRFSDYLNKVRIEESKQLLKDDRYSILNVALAVGFDDQSYFSKVFKKITGVTPKQYKDM